MTSKAEMKRDRRENVSSVLTQLCIILLSINIFMVFKVMMKSKGNKYIKMGEWISSSPYLLALPCMGKTQHPGLLTALTDPVRWHLGTPGRQELSFTSLNLEGEHHIGILSDEKMNKQ